MNLTVAYVVKISIPFVPVLLVFILMKVLETKRVLRNVEAETSNITPIERETIAVFASKSELLMLKLA